MAINFTLAYNRGFDYSNLFPSTNIDCILNNDKILKYSYKEVIVPSTNDQQQMIQIDLTEKQKISPFFVELDELNEFQFYDYNTISSIEIYENNLIINRFGRKPSSDIKIKLTFLEGGV